MKNCLWNMGQGENRYGKCIHSTDNYKDLCAMINKLGQKKRSISGHIERAIKNLNTLIEKKFVKFVRFVKKRKGGKHKKISNTFMNYSFLMMKIKRVSPA